MAPDINDEAGVLAAVDELLANVEPDKVDPATFWGAQFDAGLAWVSFPVGCGGLGVSPRSQLAVADRLRSAGAPAPLFVNVNGHGQVAPTVVTHGTAEQRERFLRPTFVSEQIWCQLFSEPQAGSDLAGLSTRAEAVEGGWRVNGQKVWTSLGHLANWGMLLARTDPDAPKHEGITAFLVPMASPGIDVRPLRQLTGDSDFNEVFMTDVFVPDNLRLGPVGHGWRVAITTLMNERVTISALDDVRGGSAVDRAMQEWQASRVRDDSARDTLVGLWIRDQAAKYLNVQARQRRAVGTPGPEESLSKLAGSELEQDVFDFTLELLGSGALFYPDGYDYEPLVDAADYGEDSDDVRRLYLRSRAATIGGGTSQIMRNILAERTLKLPREPRADAGPWRAIPRGASVR